MQLSKNHNSISIIQASLLKYRPRLGRPDIESQQYRMVFKMNACYITGGRLMMQQESITWVGNSGKALTHGTASCIDKKLIQAELNVLPVAAGDSLV